MISESKVSGTQEKQKQAAMKGKHWGRKVERTVSKKKGKKVKYKVA